MFKKNILIGNICNSNSWPMNLIPIQSYTQTNIIFICNLQRAPKSRHKLENMAKKINPRFSNYFKEKGLPIEK